MIPKAPRHGRIKPKKGPPNQSERALHEQVRLLGCQVCGRAASVHHEPFLSQGGKHTSVVALCPFHHQDQKHGRHAMSRERFNETYGIDVLALAEQNYQRYYRN